ncbi:3-phosphoshikimate 1-carboxyvinyltransferase [Helicobacter cholecystus]|uniref:3-phosphoshikimate 1-carboxyvinyltransferase n=1 Tax=Helicobacter cholecystus TaxID=45498 RepID=UPI0027394191|nr:3-phosphoshikimate 1-carboxyvinyltransferase [Helicobacter cholecystus]
MRILPKNNPVKNKPFFDIAQDKSLSHRSVIFSFLTRGESRVRGFLQAEDTLSTLNIAKTLGLKIREEGEELVLIPPLKPTLRGRIECNNAGTAMRLYAGLLASNPEGEYEFVGDESLSKRPMERIRIPLQALGATLSHCYAPFILRGGHLKGTAYHSPVASAQIKGAFILASLFAEGKSIFSEPELSRDHTERFLSSLGAEIKNVQREIHITPLLSPLPAYQIHIPNDPSSIIFFVIACLIGKDLQAEFHHVLLNPTRIQAFEVLKRMGAKLNYEIESEHIEPIGKVYVASSVLYGVEVKENIAWLIDEIPALSIAFACAQGVSKVVGAQELRVKECNRIYAIVENLNRLGIEAYELEDGLEVRGGEFRSARVQSYGDHRIAMSFALVGVRVAVEIEESECAKISFPHFFEILREYAEVEE